MGELTGRKVLLITVGAFGVIIGVNVFMAAKAIGTFPGLEVKNSYVASQTFDDDRAAQESLGWTLTAAYEPGRLRLEFRDSEGLPVEVASMKATVGRPTMSVDDITPDFRELSGIYYAPMDLAPGKWMVLLEAYADDGTRFHQRIDLFVRG
ncbi:FixH family protein [Ostreiculturibacter nitratireducens]|uniref:FixH family protein n=1 Tax=Ostreiculturibacter nitratireducens TaxID=3075226 RepID=UPI0031B5D4EA